MSKGDEQQLEVEWEENMTRERPYEKLREKEEDQPRTASLKLLP